MQKKMQTQRLLKKSLTFTVILMPFLMTSCVENPKPTTQRLKVSYCLLARDVPKVKRASVNYIKENEPLLHDHLKSEKLVWMTLCKEKANELPNP